MCDAIVFVAQAAISSTSGYHTLTASSVLVKSSRRSLFLRSRGRSVTCGDIKDISSRRNFPFYGQLIVVPGFWRRSVPHR